MQRVVLEQASLIESLQGRIAEFERRNAMLEKRNAELEARLARYENAHVPSSRLEKPSRPSKGNGKRGRPAGCEGSTRPVPVPDRVVAVTLDVCPHCRSSLGKPVKIESRVVEEIPEPRPVLVNVRVTFNAAEVNKALIELFSALLELPKDRIAVVEGMNGELKTLMGEG